MSAITPDDARLLWDAMTAVTVQKGKDAAEQLFALAITEAGPQVRTIAGRIRRDDYRLYDSNGIPDHRYTCSRLACFLINDLMHANELTDKQTANDYGYAASDRQEARKRNAARLVLSQEIARMDVADFRALVDSLAGTPATKAA